jgi:hypothetical protein
MVDEVVPTVPETRAEEIARLQREIGMRQMRLQYLVLGDPMEGVMFSARTPTHDQP